MSTPSTPDDDATQAAAWFTRLNSRQVSSATLADFRAWRRTPANRAAYARIEELWRRTGSLTGDPDMLSAVDEALARSARPLRRPIRGPLAAVTAIVLLGLAGIVVSPTLFAGKTLQTAVGEQSRVRLDDGSFVRLDTQTRLTVRLTRSERQVRLLSGRAFFEVAPDAARPFVVEAGDTAVTALGTSFEVRRDGGDVAVTLVSGSVDVREAGIGQAGRWRLRPGQQIATAARSPAPAEVDAANATSWTTGRIVLRGVSLSKAVAEVNRYSSAKVILGAGAPQDAPVSGVFDNGDTAAFVSAVSKLYDLRSVRESDGDMVLSRSDPTAG